MRVKRKLDERPATAARTAEKLLPGAVEAAAQGPVVMGLNRKAAPGLAALREQLTGTTGNAVLLKISREGSTYFLALPKM